MDTLGPTGYQHVLVVFNYDKKSCWEPQLYEGVKPVSTLTGFTVHQRQLVLFVSFHLM